MLGVKPHEKKSEKIVPDPPEEDELTAYNESKRGGPCRKPGQWRLDLLGPKKSPWNLRAVRIFRRNFLKSKLYGEWPKEDIERALFVHMDTLRARYGRQKGEISFDEYNQQKIKAARKSRLQTVRTALAFSLP